MIQQVENTIHQEMYFFMKHLHGGPRRRKSYQIQIILKKFYNGEQTTHTQPSIDVFEDPSDIDVDEQEVTQSSEFDEMETTYQQLRRSKGIQKPNPKYVNAAIVEDRINES